MKQLVVKIFIVTLKFRKTIAMDLQKEITNEIKFGFAIVVIGILGFIIVGLVDWNDWEEWPSTNGILKSTEVREGVCDGGEYNYDCWILTAEFEFTTSKGEKIERIYRDKSGYEYRQGANNAENNLQSMNEFTVYYNPDRPDENYIFELENAPYVDPVFMRAVCGIIPTIVGTGFILGSLYFAHKNKN